MPATDPFKRYFEAGLEFSELTRKRAESIVKDLVKAGEVQREQTQKYVDELIERSRHASATFAEVVRTEVTRQLTDLGLVQAPKKAAATATKVAKQTTGAAKKAATKSSGTAKAAAKKTSGTAKAAAKKVPATAKKAAATAKKVPATAKKATGQS